MNTRKMAALGVLLLFGAAACDLEVTNPNQPETERVLATPADIESLIAGSYNTWWGMTETYLGAGPILSTAAFQHSATAANFGMVEYSAVPVRPEVNNTPAHGFASYFERTWYHSYRAISAASDGMRRINEGVEVSNTQRARAFAKLTQGVAHGSLGMLYDQAFIFDETMDPTDDQELAPYPQVIAAAIGYLDEAISLSQGQTFTIPSDWIGNLSGIDGAYMVRLANSYKAYFLANSARQPGELTNGDWGNIRTWLNAGLQQDFSPVSLGSEDQWWSWGAYYRVLPGAWSQVNNTVLGMADQSGGFQEWITSGWGTSDHDPFVIVTPDRRFPQGSTLAEQATLEARGIYIEVPDPSYSTFGAGIGGQRGRPDRGTWRWSNYRDFRHDVLLLTQIGPLPHLTVPQLRLLLAEAEYHLGNQAGAADIINETRADPNHAALNATDASGVNTDCVPKLPSGACGDLFEMLKWEKRLETYHVNLGAWYFDGRRWGDLMQGTFLHLPVPGRELEVLEMPYYTFGGPGGPANGAAPVGTYGY